MSARLILAIDPGQKKCGLAVVTEDGEQVFLETIQKLEFPAKLLLLYEKFQPQTILLGNGTCAGAFFDLIKQTLPIEAAVKVEKVDERNTTLLARELYWQINPPTGWRRLLPKGLLSLPEPVDAYAALALAKRWLGRF